MTTYKAYRLGYDPTNEYGLEYVPDYKPEGIISYWAGRGPAGEGGSCNYRDTLKPFFMDYITRVNAEWFIPTLERLARGEKVLLSEIEETCRRSTGHGLLVKSYPE